MREHFCNLLHTYLPRVVKKELEEELKERKDLDVKLFNTVVNLFLRKTRGGQTDEEGRGRRKKWNVRDRRRD